MNNPEAPVLTASGGTTYQWFKNGTAISGATANAHTVTSEGSYTVQGSAGSCKSLMSDAQVIIVTGDNYFNAAGQGLYLYPNPAANILMVPLHQFETDQEVKIDLTDLLGRNVESTKGTGGTVKEINVQSFPSGKYLVILQQSRQRVVVQFIKSN